MRVDDVGPQHFDEPVQRARCAQVRSRIHPARKLDVMKLHAVRGGGDALVTEWRGRAGNVNFHATGHERAAQLAQKIEVTNESWYNNEQGAPVLSLVRTAVAETIRSRSRRSRHRSGEDSVYRRYRTCDLLLRS